MEGTNPALGLQMGEKLRPRSRTLGQLKHHPKDFPVSLQIPTFRLCIVDIPTSVPLQTFGSPNPPPFLTTPRCTKEHLLHCTPLFAFDPNAKFKELHFLVNLSR